LLTEFPDRYNSST